MSRYKLSCTPRNKNEMYNTMLHISFQQDHLVIYGKRCLYWDEKVIFCIPLDTYKALSKFCLIYYCQSIHRLSLFGCEITKTCALVYPVTFSAYLTRWSFDKFDGGGVD